MARLRRKHTIIVIAHRLEDVAVCDDVVVLEGGSIAERGAPQELLQVRKAGRGGEEGRGRGTRQDGSIGEEERRAGAQGAGR
eukprot:398156-Hanusia_phi.AAC.1